MSFCVFLDFVLGSVHTVPNVNKTPEEISNLAAVFKFAESHFATENIVLLGDLNAGKNYVKNWANISIKHDPTVHWLINDSVVTTVRNFRDRAYDR